MRDLKKYLISLKGNLVFNGCFTDEVKVNEVAIEAIERAIAAEDKLAQIESEPLHIDWPEGIKNELDQYDWLVKRQTARIRELSAQVAGLRDCLNDIYPMIAGRVIQLCDAGEEKAMKQWNESAKEVYVLLEGGDK